MSEKIYEFKDEQNWFIGRWDAWTDVYNFVELDNGVARMHAAQLETLITNREQGFVVQILALDSEYQLIRFILDIINDVEGHQFVAKQEAGAIWISEGDVVYHVFLPQEGLPLANLKQEASLGDTIGDTILIATRNEGKTAEFRQFFEQLGYGVENLNDYPDLPEVAETGTTFEENARLKAETIANLTGKMVLADDSGLKVDVLGGLPGVWSARFSGPNATDATNNQKLLHELATVFEQKNRAAQFHATLVLAKPGKESLVVEADWPGYIAFSPKGENGFGYDPLFLVGETGRHSAELTREEKNQQSHRALALKKLLEAFPKW